MSVIQGKEGSQQGRKYRCLFRTDFCFILYLSLFICLSLYDTHVMESLSFCIYAKRKIIIGYIAILSAGYNRELQIGKTDFSYTAAHALNKSQTI